MMAALDDRKKAGMTELNRHAPEVSHMLIFCEGDKILVKKSTPMVEGVCRSNVSFMYLCEMDVFPTPISPTMMYLFEYI